MLSLIPLLMFSSDGQFIVLKMFEGRLCTSSRQIAAELARAGQGRTCTLGCTLVRRKRCCVQVVYPALERKVQNITPSYSVEHGEEV
jgi:hypothetical protein